MNSDTFINHSYEKKLLQCHFCLSKFEIQEIVLQINRSIPKDQQHAT